MSRLRGFRQRLAEPARLSRGAVYAVGLSIGLTFALGTFGLVQIAKEGRQREVNDQRSERQVEDIARRVIRIERQPGRGLIRRLEQNLNLCHRVPACADELDRDRPRRQRRERDEHAPDQRADRPPRTVTPPDTPSLDGDDGGDDPPGPPGTSTPSTPPSSPASPAPVVQLDPPAVDIDGPKGLLPQLLPNVNLPPVDVPPIRVP